MIAILAAVALSNTQVESLVGLGSESFRYTTRDDGEGAVVWENKKTGSRMDLGQSPEVELEVGERPESASKVVLVRDPNDRPTFKGGSVTIHLRSREGNLGVDITLAPDLDWPILHKRVEVTNLGQTQVRLLNVELGRFPMGKAKVEGGDRGFPLYLNQEFFLSLAHPAGFAHVEGNDVVLRQYPGVRIPPGKSFLSMEAIYGVAKHGEARKTFVDYVRSRMYRMTHGHDKPYAILESFGGQQEGNFKTEFTEGVAEPYLLRHLEEVAASERQNQVQFDFYSLEFWQNRAGTLKEFNPHNFPNGFNKVRDEILNLGMKPGLWIDSGNLPQWSIDQNPAMRPSYSVRDGEGSFCRASEPINQTYKDAFLYQMHVNKAGLLKFDNLNDNCVNPAHDHLPGRLYSTEAIYNGVIDFLSTLRQANPDEFIMLYWGYRSPWWLLYGDTYFECGDHIEAASPAQYPTPYARDAVTQRLDQAQLKITDTPWLGKDSLGVWLSDWAWNSGIGNGRWQEAAIMDMGRGSLLFQIWTDANWLTPPKRAQVATFIDLLKANSDCFDNSRFILGDPNNAEPYGYSGSNGKKAFLSIDNACLQDRSVKLDLGPSMGLPAGGSWDVYRWYPRPAKLSSAGFQPVSKVSLMMRPYEVDLLEVVPKGTPPSLGREFPSEDAGKAFAERTRELPLDAKIDALTPAPPARWQAIQPISVEADKGAKLKIRSDRSVVSAGSNKPFESYTIDCPVSGGKLTGLLLETLPDSSLPGSGPGRAVNGNFQLTNLRVLIGGREVKVASAEADFSQTTFGGWPVNAAIDADAKSGWSIHPEVGQAHAAVFRFERPVEASGQVQVILTNGDNGHSLGRFRLSTTSDEAPSLPVAYRPGRITLSLNLPPTRSGGLIMLVGGGSADSPHGSIGGRSLSLASVWSAQSNWECPWSAWRGVIEPSDESRRVEITIDRSQTLVGAKFTAYFLPN